MGGGTNASGRPEGALDGAYYDPRRYTRENLRMLERVRADVGDEVELIHDIHERLPPAMAVEFMFQA